MLQHSKSSLEYESGLIASAKITNYKCTQYQIEKSTTKAIAVVDNKIDYMVLQRRQVIKALVNQVDVEDPLCMKYASTSFQFVAETLISVIVTINRTVPLQRYQTSSSHSVMIMTTKLRNSI